MVGYAMKDSLPFARMELLLVFDIPQRSWFSSTMNLAAETTLIRFHVR